MDDAAPPPPGPKCENCEKLEAKVKTLEEMVGRLLKRIEELERAGKRQAGPFSKAAWSLGQAEPRGRCRHPARSR